MFNPAQSVRPARVLNRCDAALQAAACGAVSVATQGLPQRVRVALLQRAARAPDIAQLVQLRAELYWVLALASCESEARQAVAPLDEIVGKVAMRPGFGRPSAAGGLMRWLGFTTGRRRPGIHRLAPASPPRIVSSPR